MPAPAMIKPTSTVSASWYFSYAVFFCPTVDAEPSLPPDSDSNVGVFTAVNVVPAEAEPQLVPDVLWSIQYIYSDFA